MNGTCAVSAPSLPVQRWPSQRMFHVPMQCSALIKWSHNPLSSGYMLNDSVPVGQVMMEHDKIKPLSTMRLGKHRAFGLHHSL